MVVRFLITWFEAYATWRTGHVAQYIEQLIRAPNSPCHVDLFTTYFHTKTSFEVSITIRISELRPVLIIYMVDSEPRTARYRNVHVRILHLEAGQNLQSPYFQDCRSSTGRHTVL